jgi:hypothetical protein
MSAKKRAASVSYQHDMMLSTQLLLIFFLVIVLIMASQLHERVIYRLFNNYVNFGILVAISVLLVLIDPFCGTLFTLIVFYGCVTYGNNGTASYYAPHSYYASHYREDAAVDSQLKLPNVGYSHQFSKPPNSADVYASHAGDCDNVHESFISQVNQQQIAVTAQPVHKSRSGFDMMGCRYDGIESEQSTTERAPPVAMVSAAFYPLHSV